MIANPLERTCEGEGQARRVVARGQTAQEGVIMSVQADQDGTPFTITSNQVLMPRKQNHCGKSITQSTHSYVGIHSRS